MEARESKKGGRGTVWFERIEQAVHRALQHDGSLTPSQALSQAIASDPEAREVCERHRSTLQDEAGGSNERQEQERGPRVYVRTPPLDGSHGGVLVEVARLRSLKAGTDYDDELEAVMRDYPNLADLYEGD